jgi:NAD(P)-dependent dehydrogenase (short-subunit alcohol dehydrogenase family)
LQAGHQVVLHARSENRLAEVVDLVERGAVAVVGDLAVAAQTRSVAKQVNQVGQMDAMIHNAGVYTGADIPAVNVVAPYLLTALIGRPSRLVYLSSGMHRGGRPALRGLNPATAGRLMSYSDSKLLVTTLAAAVAQRWPSVITNAVDPGWVPTRMGGPSATDDLELGHVTQAWLAVSGEAAARTSGGYWYHQRRQSAHPAVSDPDFQDMIIDGLAELTGVAFPVDALPPSCCREGRRSLSWLRCSAAGAHRCCRCRQASPGPACGGAEPR